MYLRLHFVTGVRPGGKQMDIYAKDSFGQFIHFPSVVSQQKFKVPSFDGVLELTSPLNVKVSKELLHVYHKPFLGDILAKYGQICGKI